VLAGLHLLGGVRKDVDQPGSERALVSPRRARPRQVLAARPRGGDGRDRAVDLLRSGRGSGRDLRGDLLARVRARLGRCGAVDRERAAYSPPLSILAGLLGAMSKEGRRSSSLWRRVLASCSPRALPWAAGERSDDSGQRFSPSPRPGVQGGVHAARRLHAARYFAIRARAIPLRAVRVGGRSLAPRASSALLGARGCSRRSRCPRVRAIRSRAEIWPVRPAMARGSTGSRGGRCRALEEQLARQRTTRGPRAPPRGHAERAGRRLGNFQVFASCGDELSRRATASRRTPRSRTHRRPQRGVPRGDRAPRFSSSTGSCIDTVPDARGLRSAL
jgi:hypothetical protein